MAICALPVIAAGWVWWAIQWLIKLIFLALDAKMMRLLAQVLIFCTIQNLSINFYWEEEDNEDVCSLQAKTEYMMLLYITWTLSMFRI